MKFLARLGAWGKQIRGWLPMEPATVIATLHDRRGEAIAVAGTFFFVVGAFFLPFVIPSYYVINGPFTQLLCPPRTPCAPIYLDLSLITPVFLLVLGEMLVAFGMVYHSGHRPINTAIAVAGTSFAIVGTFFLSYVPSIPTVSVACSPGGPCISIDMSPITPIVLIVFGAALIAFGFLYRRRHRTS